MADGSTTLLYRFLGIDAGAGAQFDRMAAKTTMLGESSSSALTKLKALTVGGAVGVIALGVASIKMASDYQRSMTLIQTQAGASKAEVDSFSKSLLSMAGEVAQSPEALSVSLYHVYSALKKVGADGPQMLNTVRIAAEGAKVGNTDLEDTTNSLTATLASGIVRFNQASKAMGYLNATVGAGDMKFSDLNQALGTGLLVTMRTFGVSMKDTGAALAVFGDNNIRGADAATKLRMSVQDLVKPAANADEVLSKIGTSGDQLRNVLQNKGLNGALQLLKEKLDAAGVTGNKVGGFLEDAFTKKAGAGLAILLTRLKQFDEARDTETKAAAGFGDAWVATTHTMSFALDRLKAEAEAAMITLGEKLLPSATHIADALGRDLPAAVSKLQQILGPLEHIVGGVLAVGFKTLGTVVHAAGAALASVGDFLASHKTLFTTVAVAVAGMWLAFKGYEMAKVALLALRGLMDTFVLKAMYAKDAALGFGASMSTMSIGTLAAKAAMLGVGVALAILTYKWQKNAEMAAKAKADTEAYYGVLQQTKGAINDAVVAQVTQTFATNGQYDAARKYGIQLGVLTQAALGNKGAMNQLTAALGHGNVEQYALLQSVKEQAGALDDARHQYRLATGQTKANTTANDQNATAADKAALAAKQQADAIAQLTAGLQKLINAEISQLQTVDSFKEGMLQLGKQVKENGTSLSQNTQKGLANRDALLSILGSAEKAAEGSRNYSKALLDNVKQFEQFAAKAGFSKAAVDRLLRSVGLLRSQVQKKMTLSLDTSGIDAGLNQAVADAAAAGTEMANAMNARFKEANGIASPSKVYRQYGIWIVQGLVNGVKTYSVKAKSAAHELALGLISGWKEGTSSLKDALTSPVQKVLDRLTNVVDNAISKQQDILKKARSNLQNLLKQRAADIRSLAGTVSGGADLGGLFGTDDLGNPTVTNIGTFLSGQAKTIENFAKDLKWAARHHLSPMLLSEIAGLGAEQGDQVLKQFMSGQASIGQANRAESTIQHFSTMAARTAEDAVYAGRVAADRKEVREQTRELKEIRRTLHAIERKAAKAASTHITIDAKTGKPVVDKQFIEEIIKGIKKAQRTAGKSLI